MSGSAVNSPSSNRWAQAWPDAVAFAGGLAVAWYGDWQTTELVWSLWLSSLVVGYALIVWMIFGPVLVRGRAALADGAIKVNGQPGAGGAVGGSVLLIGGLFMLAFFTVHFGMFHFVHSAFLSAFFPVGSGPRSGMPGFALYARVVANYWMFLPLAFLAERRAFRAPAGLGSVLANAPALAARTAAAPPEKNNGLSGMMTPYKNVVRMHLLIFFFAFAHFAQLENFLVYAVVYAVYFFPWSLLRKPAAPAN